MSPDLKDYLNLTIKHLFFLGKQEEAKVIEALLELAYEHDITNISELFNREQS